jgi:hypothetical protein
LPDQYSGAVSLCLRNGRLLRETRGGFPGLHVLFDASRVRALADSLGDELKGLK